MLLQEIGEGLVGEVLKLTPRSRASASIAAQV